MGHGVIKGKSWSDWNPHRHWLMLLSRAIRKGRSKKGKIHYRAIMLEYGLGECLSLLLKGFCWLSQVHQDSVSYLEPMDWNFNYLCIIYSQQCPGYFLIQTLEGNVHVTKWLPSCRGIINLTHQDKVVFFWIFPLGIFLLYGLSEVVLATVVVKIVIKGLILTIYRQGYRVCYN